MERRNFIKLVGLTFASALLPGCTKKEISMDKSRLSEYQLVISACNEDTVMIIRFEKYISDGNKYDHGIVKRLFADDNLYEKVIYESDDNIELSFYEKYDVVLQENFKTVLEKTFGDKERYTCEEINNLIATYQNYEKKLIKTL